MLSTNMDHNVTERITSNNIIIFLLQGKRNAFFLHLNKIQTPLKASLYNLAYITKSCCKQESGACGLQGHQSSMNIEWKYIL